MTNIDNSAQCPHCNNHIELNEIFRNKIRDNLKAELYSDWEKEKKVEFSKKVNQETEKLRQEMLNKIKRESEEEISIFKSKLSANSDELNKLKLEKAQLDLEKTEADTKLRSIQRQYEIEKKQAVSIATANAQEEVETQYSVKLTEQELKIKSMETLISELKKKSSQKILKDFSREFDAIHAEFEVPYTMMQIFQFSSNELAKSFLEEQVYAKNVLIDQTVTDEDISYDDYTYERIFESADMSGTSKETGDCLYDKTVNVTNAIGDETHFVQCVLHDKVIQVFMYEDYTTIDENFAFKIMDIILVNINADNDKTVKNILQLDNLNSSFPTENKITNTNKKESTLSEKEEINQMSPKNTQPKKENIDPELDGSSVGITNFSCKQDDFGTVNMFGQFINGENSFEKVPVNIIIESYNGEVLAFGQEDIMKVNPFEDRNIEGYVFLDKPFYKCYATVDWERTK